jgi:transposase
VNRKTAAFSFFRLREIIAYEMEAKGKRGRDAGDKIPVFGLLKRGEKIYTKIIPDASGATLIPIIKRKVVPPYR